MRRALLLVLALAPLAVRAQEPQRPAQPSPPPLLRAVRVETADVFDDERAARNPLFALANALHATTHDAVVAREVWLQPGDPLRTEDVEEIERNLRALGLFGGVDAEVLPLGAGSGEADLLVRTRDRFSLGASASIGFVGGQSKVDAGISESNLFGTGKSIGVRYTDEEDDRSYRVRYEDPQFLGSRHTLGVTIGETTDGPYGELALVRPFRRLEDPHSYGVELATFERNVDYYRLGDTVAEVPMERQSMRLFGAAGDGPRELRRALGLDLRLRRSRYEPATGPAAADFRVPPDSDEAELGPYWTLDWRPRFLTVQRLDAIDYDEDVGLGVHFGARVAARWRDEAGTDGRFDPVGGIDLRAAAEPLPNALLSVAAGASVESWDGELQGHVVSGALHGYWFGLPQQTLAASVTYDTAGESRDLEPQLTLGEDNGLRGYPAREFSGTARVRVNVEDRIDTGMELLSVRLGLVAFFDAGFVHDPVLGLAMDDALRSVGCGLRLGSSHLLGSRVVRVDVAWPLDDPFGEGYGTSVSLTIGQVFSFFGNASSLTTEF